MNQNVKELVTDIDQLSIFCDAIDPRKEGKLLQEIVLALKNTMREKGLLSLSAPQIGYSRRVFCIRFGENDYRTFINPVIENVANFTMNRESCSSLPNKEYIRPRHATCKVYYLTPMNKIESRKLVGVAAFKFQHCLDHLDGMVLSDIGLEIDELWDKATEEERDEVLRAYMDALDIAEKECKKAVAEDKELADIDDASKFIASVQSGETKLEFIKEDSKDVNTDN